MKNPEMLPQAQQTQANPTGVPAADPSELPPASPAVHEVPRRLDALEQTTSQAIIDALEASNAALRVQNVQLMASNAALQAVNAELQDLGSAYQRQLQELTGLAARKRVEEALYHAKGELEQRVQQLSRLTAILEATTDIVGIADTHERIVYLNAAGRQLWGLGEQGGVDLRVADFFPDWALRIIREEGVPTARHAGTWTGETALLGRDGREIPVSQVIIAHTSLEGKLESFSTIMRNITEEKHTRDMLRHRAEEMEAIAYSASHDLQAPLRTFEGYARWLLEDYGEMLGDTGRQLCKEIITDALHMKTLLDGLLEYSRIGRRHVEAVVVEVNKVLNWVLHDLQLVIANTGAIMHVPEKLLTVIYPEVRLTQIFSNLLSNALKFTANRVPEIFIEYAELERHYRFSVRDNGIGIAPEHFGRVFEIFRRLHTREAYPGTGVGLTIVKKIVESHGGQIGVTSTPGVGSTFWFTVPKLEKPPESS